jgi:CcmD family protein
MGTFVAGYLIVWFAVVLYVARLGRRQRRLQEQIDAFQSAWQAQEDRGEARSKAA